MGSKEKGHGLLTVEDCKDSEYARTARSQGLDFVLWSTKRACPSYGILSISPFVP